MNVNTANSSGAQSVATIFNPQTRAPALRQRELDTDQQRGITIDQQPQSAQRIQQSPRGVQLLEEETQRQQSSQQQNAESSSVESEALNPNAARAVSAYQSLANLDRRQEIQSMLGVDVYA